ncbi:MAG: AAA family ATPase [Methylovulum sp.]|nr:AAA family ATPase [Methylovulum sp.]
MNVTPDSTPAYPPLIHALCHAGAYPHPVDPIRVIETHISWILLTGQYAYKIKKPVNFGFLDFSTLEKRHFFCLEELRLNRRSSSNLYIDVLPIAGTPDNPKLGGTGQAFEYAVKMRQFPAGQLLGELAANGQLDAHCPDQIADRIADFHALVAHADDGSPYGDSGTIRHWFVENFDQIGVLLNNGLELQQMKAIQAWGDNEWQGKAALMQLRKQQGYVRECHGDLHLGNMTLIGGQIVLFDCIEFNPELRWIDVISDLAFLMIDLLRFGYDGYAYRVLNRYLQITGDYAGLGVLHYYLIYRALVRAKLALLRMAQLHDAGDCKQVHDEYTAFAQLAKRFTNRSRPSLIITHGYSGTGKSTFAAQLAEKTGAIFLRSDIERKRLFGYGAKAQTNGEVYTQTASLQTYQRLAELAKAVMQAGFCAIVDAAFLKTARRRQFRQLAEECGVAFFILDFNVPEPVLSARISQRQAQQNDASEATIEVLHQQMQSAEPFSLDELDYVVQADADNIMNIINKIDPSPSSSP